MELNNTPSATAKNITISTARRAALGLPAPNSFETLVLKLSQKPREWKRQLGDSQMKKYCVRVVLIHI